VNARYRPGERTKEERGEGKLEQCTQE
jgi:hypothetical protein